MSKCSQRLALRQVMADADERRIDDMDTQHLLQKIREKFADMTEEQKQKVLDILLAESCEICDVEREAV